MENLNALEYEIEMATLDLKGRRYRDAIEKFSELARITNNTGAWSGLGLAKLGLIMEDVTVTEVFHCFNKALSIEENKHDVYVLSIEASKEAIKELYKIYVKAIILEREAKKDAFTHKLNAVAGAFLTIDSRVQKNTTSSLVGAGLTALSYNGYLNSKNTSSELKAATIRIQGLISEIAEQTIEFNHKNEIENDIADFKRFLVETEGKAIELTKTEEEKKADEQRKVQEAEMKQKYLPVSGPEILNDSEHIYHLYKKEAESLYAEGKVEEAYEKITYARRIYAGEEHVNALHQKYKSELEEKHAKKYKKDKTVFIVFLILVLAGSILEGGDASAIGSNLMYMSVFGGAVLMYRKYQRDNVLKAPAKQE